MGEGGRGGRGAGGAPFESGLFGPVFPRFQKDFLGLAPPGGAARPPETILKVKKYNFFDFFMLTLWTLINHHLTL